MRDNYESVDQMEVFALNIFVFLKDVMTLFYILIEEITEICIKR